MITHAGMEDVGDGIVNSGHGTFMLGDRAKTFWTNVKGGIVIVEVVAKQTISNDISYVVSFKYAVS